ncbi:Uncharacterised protein [Vibrio cholerae]|nr:Uncharacterised protein [Vibrio cholerae]
MTYFGKSHLKTAVEQIIRVLDRDNSWQFMFFCKTQVAHHSPRRFIRNSDITHFTHAHQIIERFQCFNQRYFFLLVWIRVVELTESIGLALRPVKLIQVDIIRLQTT